MRGRLGEVGGEGGDCEAGGGGEVGGVAGGEGVEFAFWRMFVGRSGFGGFMGWMF